MTMKPDDIEALRGRLRYFLYAERVTRILCRRSGAVEGYQWRAPPKSWADQTRLTSHRNPPLPFHSMVHKGPGWCRVCGQPVYGGGSFRTFAGEQSKRLTWHTICTAAYFLMTKPADYTAILILRQGQVCAITGAPLPLPYRNVEVDHDVPLYRVARDHGDEPWYDLLRFWMTGNLRAITRAAYLAKCADEARDRAESRIPAIEQGMLL